MTRTYPPRFREELRRHHRAGHITLSGEFEPVGGYLRDEAS